MSKAYRCNSCDEYFDGVPAVEVEFYGVGSPEPHPTADSLGADLCEACWREAINDLGLDTEGIDG